jgi:hypothetical protein
MKNETNLRNDLSKKLDINLYKSDFDLVSDNIKTSVDFKLNIGDTNFLFEVDSNNVAKIIFGQYLLLNKAKNLPENPFLIIIHCYKGYNIERTKKHLKYAKEVYGCFIPYITFTEEDWIKNTENKSRDNLKKYLISLTKSM